MGGPFDTVARPVKLCMFPAASTPDLYWLVDVGQPPGKTSDACRSSSPTGYDPGVSTSSTALGLQASVAIHWRIPHCGAGWCFALRGIYVHVLCDDPCGAHCQQESNLRSNMTRMKQELVQYMAVIYPSHVILAMSMTIGSLHGIYMAHYMALLSR